MALTVLARIRVEHTEPPLSPPGEIWRRLPLPPRAPLILQSDFLGNAFILLSVVNFSLEEAETIPPNLCHLSTNRRSLTIRITEQKSKDHGD
jgi:hypothetical protein